MNWFKAVTVSKFALLILCTVLLFAIALLGTPDFLFNTPGVFEEDAITLGLDLNGGSIITYEAVPQDGAEITADGMSDVEEVMRRRLDNMGYTEALVYVLGDNCIRIEIPGIANPTEAAETIGSTAKLSFTDNDGNEFMDGKLVNSASAQYGDTDGDGTAEFFVSLEFNADGAAKFAEATKKAASLSSSNANYIIITLDGAQISKASVKEEIKGGSAIISGDFDQQEVEELAALINGGSLPYDLLCDGEHGSLSSVAASLGERSLETSLVAGAIGIALVIIFMIIMYRFPGVISALCLLAYTAIMAILLIVTKANLTLPGIAGIILGIGMAVDSNVVVFERIKEELRAGKTTAAAVKAGFSNALSAVIDSNITTLIAAGVLWYLGSGSIQGFAVTLFMSVCVSLVTSIFVTKAYLKIAIDLGITKISAYGVKERNLSETSGKAKM